jgi:hydroxypyruvate isomerase
MLRFNPNLRWLYTELPMLDRYAAAARAGFRGVEVAFPYEHSARDIAKILDDNGLTLVQILTPCNWEAGERGIAALPGREKDFRSSVQVAIEYAVQVGKPLVHAMAGNLEPGMYQDSGQRKRQTLLRHVSRSKRRGLARQPVACCV